MNSVSDENRCESPKVALVGGQWAQNIGNAFFNIGGMWCLEQVFGRGSVGYIQDQPGYRTLHNKLKGNPLNYLDPVRYLDIEWLVLQGPVLNSWFDVNWRGTLLALKARGVRIMLHSSAFFKFTSSEIESVRKFLSEVDVDIISTRDRDSYNILKDFDLDCKLIDGIDAGFFVSDSYSPLAWGDSRPIVMNFDRYPEPDFLEADRPGSGVEIFGREYVLKVPRNIERLSKSSKIRAYVGSVLDRRVLPEEFDGRPIIRTEHRYFPHVTGKIYRTPKSTSSDEPWTYLTLYKAAELTFSDRVHACVATLAYGNSAMLFTPSPRAALFNRVGCEGIRKGLVSLPPERLAEHKQRHIDQLRKAVQR